MPVAGGVRHGPAAVRALCEAGVDLILTGHVHNPFAVALPDSDGRSDMTGAGTLSLRARGAPASFSVIDAGTEALTVTAQAWTGGEFEPFASWTWPRRGAITDRAAAADAVQT